MNLARLSKLMGRLLSFQLILGGNFIWGIEGRSLVTFFTKDVHRWSLVTTKLPSRFEGCENVTTCFLLLYCCIIITSHVLDLRLSRSLRISWP